MPPPLIEIAVDNLPDALAAHAAGADRLELCSDLALHGLSASPRLLADFRMNSALPVAAMVRPRSGGFVASPSDIFLAPRQAEALLGAGADAIVCGFLNPDQTIDQEIVARLVTVAGATPVVFHRAFDLIPDPLRAIDELVKLKVSRILASGLTGPSAAHALGLAPPPAIHEPLVSRLDMIRRLIRHAAGRIEILVGGGVRPGNAREFLTHTGARELHSACRDGGSGRLNTNLVRELVANSRAVASQP